MNVDPDRLTEVLAGRLAAIVPDGFYVRGMDGMLWYSAEAGRFPGQLGDYHVGGSGTYVRDNLEACEETGTPEQAVASVAWWALDQLQDFVDEASHDPWPGERTPPHPYAEIRDRALHLWYGGDDSTSPVVLACEPVPLALVEGICG